MADKKGGNGYVKRYNVQKDHKEFGKTKNYDFEKQNEPDARMGNNSFANLPDAPIMKNFSRSHNRRSGVINDFSCGLEDESGIHENKCYPNNQEYA
jgi:hypothetical protein